MSNNQNVETKVVTGPVRLSYAHVWEANAMNAGDKPKYSASLIIPKSDKATLNKIKKAVQAAKEIGKGSKFGGKIPPVMKEPLRDGDEERPEDEAYKGSYFINANSATRPGIVDLALNPIMDQEDVYSGCYARVSINFYAFNTNGNKGIACGLNNIQKVRDGEPLGGRASAENDFDDDFSEGFSYEEDDSLDFLG
ncbi:MAG: DUF2815 family protein [Eubacterium sp.]